MTKARKKEPAQEPLVAISRDQLEVYAAELQQHFREQKKMHGELEDRNQQLEQRLMEITSLNRLFQDHLTECSSLFEVYRNILTRLGRQAEEASALSQFAKANLTTDVFPAAAREPIGGVREEDQAA